MRNESSLYLKKALRRTLEESFRPMVYSLFPLSRGVYDPLAKKLGLASSPAETIRDAIDSGSAMCAGRIGKTELRIMQRFRVRKLGKILLPILDSLASGDPDFYFRKAPSLLEAAGLAPLNRSTESKFFERTLEALQEVDIFASWVPGEGWFEKELRSAAIVELEHLEPFRSDEPWSIALASKKVLVIHPFDQSIQSQYLSHGDKIFGGRGVLPEFELLTYRPAQAYLGEIKTATQWFKKLDEMVASISSLSFDIAIIGAGPFGLPLASEIKKLGKQAVVMGGATQLLFGILGRRWEADPVVQSLKNELWVRPSASETPLSAQTIEKSAYW